MNAKYDANQVANWFIDHARHKDGKGLTIMHLLKFVYLAHGWHLGIYGSPLFANEIQVWQFGPVVPDVYDAFGGREICLKKPGEADITDERDHRFLERIYDKYGHLRPWKLSEMTHEENSPWDITLGKDQNNWYGVIKDDLIRDYYQDMSAELGG